MLQHVFQIHISLITLNPQLLIASLPLPNLSLSLPQPKPPKPGSRMASKQGGEVLVSPKSSSAPPALRHCCLPEQCQVPARGAAIPLPTQKGCYAPSRRGDNPSATGDAGPGCSHKPSPLASTLQSRARAALWLERPLTTGEATLCSSPVS